MDALAGLSNSPANCLEIAQPGRPQEAVSENQLDGDNEEVPRPMDSMADQPHSKRRCVYCAPCFGEFGCRTGNLQDV
jgi:hypothetical protein